MDTKTSQAENEERLRQVASGLAHDFSNVLAGVLGNVELAQAELPSDHPAQSFLESILEASNRGRDLVRQVQAFSRRQTGEQSEVPLQLVVSECEKQLRSVIGEQVQLECRTEGDCPSVLADPVAIQQVIMNLGTNAWHALPRSEGRIEITLQTTQLNESEASRLDGLPAGRYVCLGIRDNGHGMDSATQQRIFEPFFTTKRSRKALGLGLSIVQNVIKAHHGAIRVQSAPGNDTTVSVYLRAIPAVAEPSVPPASAPKSHGARIILVDDEPTLAAVTEKSLTRSGHLVTRFDRADRALEKFRELPHEFDLVITDYAMPGMSGTDLAAALLTVRPDLPILLVSGFVDQSVSDTAEALGIREVLLKPVAIDGLRSAISRALARPRPPSLA